jgi:hypothetical protein
VICASSVLLVVLNVTGTDPHFEWPGFWGAGQHGAIGHRPPQEMEDEFHAELNTLEKAQS